jgi:uncharacterized membrane protein
MPKPPKPRQTSLPANAKAAQSSALPTQVAHTSAFAGPIPPPEYLEQYDRIVPGTAKLIIDAFERESRHRQELTKLAQNANIAAQQKQQALVEAQSKSVFRSDATGQICGLTVSLACVIGTVYLAVNGHDGTRVCWPRSPQQQLFRLFSPSARGKDEK